jgi:hypothetical protein
VRKSGHDGLGASSGETGGAGRFKEALLRKSKLDDEAEGKPRGTLSPSRLGGALPAFLGAEADAIVDLGAEAASFSVA